MLKMVTDRQTNGKLNKYLRPNVREVNISSDVSSTGKILNFSSKSFLSATLQNSHTYQWMNLLVVSECPECVPLNPFHWLALFFLIIRIPNILFCIFRLLFDAAS